MDRTAATPRIGIRCDAGPAIGVGHLMRCHALAEELLARGAHVEFLGGLGDLRGLEWARDLVGRRRPAPPPGPSPGRPPAPAAPEELAAQVRRGSLDAVVLDSYTLDPRCAGLLRAAGTTVLAIVDDDTRGQNADLFLDQNLGAEELSIELPPGSARLAGARYVLLRDAVRELRPPVPCRTAATGEAGRTAAGEAGRAPAGAAPSMLCVFGGTDAAGVAPAVLRLAASTGAPFAATVVAARESTASALAAIPLAPGQSVTAIAPTGDLPALALKADLVLSAAGSSTWEMLCLGIPTALVRVADNQRRSYDAAVSRGLAVGLGGPPDHASVDPEAGRALRRLLTDPAARAALAAPGHALIDGRGRERVADALLARISGRISGRISDTAGDLR